MNAMTVNIKAPRSWTILCALVCVSRQSNRGAARIINAIVHKGTECLQYGAKTNGSIKIEGQYLAKIYSLRLYYQFGWRDTLYDTRVQAYVSSMK